MDKITSQINERIEEFIAIREHIHSFPELSFEEYETSKFIQNILEKENIKFSIVAKTGIVVILEGKNPSTKCLAFRSDLDALPIIEQNEVKYKSQRNGIMHACGHDVHSTCLLSSILILNKNKDSFEGTLKFIFQPGEEKHPGGASLLIKENVLENPKVDAIMALHVYPHLPVGKIGVKKGKYMASADEIYITIHGKGGHAALPQQTIDPIVIAAEMIQGMQNIISRKKNPLYPSVLTFGKIEGGVAPNVIPDVVKIAGTLRCMDENWRFEAHKWIKKYAETLCMAWDASVEVEILVGYPCLYNHEDLTDKVSQNLGDCFGVENIETLEMRMAAEDFSFYTHHVPGCFFRIGTNYKDEKYLAPVHNPNFDIDPNAIAIGIRAFCHLAQNLDISDIKL